MVNGFDGLFKITLILTHRIYIYRCGDGRVFPKNYGFTTFGNIAFSPYFKAFRMKGDDRIKFKCQFTACQRPGGCNGVSIDY